MRGRKPKPRSVHVRNGNPSKLNLNYAEPAPAAGEPDCPRHLTRVAREEWGRITGELRKMQLLFASDRAAIAAYCQTWALWVEAVEYQQQGLLVGTGKKKKVNPFISIGLRALETMHRYLSDFGLTPCARTRMKSEIAAPQKPVKELEAFISQ